MYETIVVGWVVILVIGLGGWEKYLPNPFAMTEE
jgi:hypothetical protein